MNFLETFDSLFKLPFLTGLIFACVLPLVGMYLRLRDEWLAALAFAQMAAAGSLTAALLHAPFKLGAIVASCAAAAAKGWFARAGNNGYALFMIFGWSVAVLLIANLPIAEQLGHALFDGQLYFTGMTDLLYALVYSLLCAGIMFWLSRRLLLERMFPDFFSASGMSARRYHLFFDLLVAVGIALTTATIGVMAAFGLVFVPPMIAYQWGRSWKGALVVSIVVGVAAYLGAFMLALVFDQPFGPVLVLVLIGLAIIGFLLRLLTGWRQSKPA
jgi:zinc/manganese transport system permease protein